MQNKLPVSKEFIVVVIFIFIFFIFLTPVYLMKNDKVEPAMINCPSCEGTGYVFLHKVCRHCKGKGEVNITTYSYLNRLNRLSESSTPSSISEPIRNYPPVDIPGSMPPQNSNDYKIEDKVNETNYNKIPCNSCSKTGYCSHCGGNGCKFCQSTGKCLVCDGKGYTLQLKLSP